MSTSIPIGLVYVRLDKCPITHVIARMIAAIQNKCSAKEVKARTTRATTHTTISRTAIQISDFTPLNRARTAAHVCLLSVALQFRWILLRRFHTLGALFRQGEAVKCQE